MTLPFVTFKAAIKTWVEAQSGLVAQWRDEKGGWHQKPRILLHLMDSSGVGEDFLEYVQDTDLDVGSDFVPTVKGNRAMLLSMIAETRDQSGNNTALYYLEKVRTSLKKPSTRSTLYTAGLVASSAEPAKDISKWLDDRVESKAHLDVHLSAVVNDRDEGEAESYVQKATVTGELTTPAGDNAGWVAEEFPE